MIRLTSCPPRLGVLVPSMVLACTVVTAAAADAQPLPIAVLDFATDGKTLAATGHEVRELLVAGLSSVPDLVLVERARLDELLSEIEFGMSGYGQHRFCGADRSPRWRQGARHRTGVSDRR